VVAAEDMPRVPEEPSVPKSLGGLLPHLSEGVSSAEADESLSALAERAQETTDDINERADVAAQLMDDESDPLSTASAVAEDHEA
jgi:hypothetical protein